MRGERPLDAGDGPLSRLAAYLRRVRREAGSPAYRELGRRVHFAASTLSEAAGGRRLPSLAVTLAPCAGLGNTVRLWDLADRSRPPTVLTGHTGAVFSLAYRPDGRWLASGSHDHTVRLWQGSESRLALTGHIGAVSAIVFAPDGHTLVTASHDRSAQLRETDLARAEARGCALPAAERARHFPEVDHRDRCG
ncbi:WD40 repeat domain-containing protein [Crossiella cryophila]|uniref:WD40 repeat domain-containing protein n=1 Tax=Crossiella cryophila TaxID=43355 RepID=A0A7W7CBA4_9PSEU|nr:hypothetical protein [Crossiella cryophila]MBB4677969.1 hypothetical protein [Crossiella cryophila]